MARAGTGESERRAASICVDGRMRRIALLVTGLILLSLAFAPRAPAFLYWSNFDTNSIGRGNLDGMGTPNQSFITSVNAAGGVAVDGAHVYWTQCLDGGSIGRANIDGTGANLDFIPGANLPCGVEVDASFVYWTECGETDTLGRGNIDGTDPDFSFITVTDGSAPCGDPAVNASFIYWANSGGTTIGRADIGGTNTDPDFITGASIPCGVAVNDSFIYWANFGTDSIGRANLDGSGTPNPNFITAATDPCGVAVDDSFIYWTNAGLADSIGRANLDGTNPNQNFATGAPGAFAVAVDSLTAPPASPSSPSNAFTVEKPKLNKKKGTATLTVEVPGPGALVLAGKGLVTQQSAAASRAATAAPQVVTAGSKVTLKVVSKGKKRRALNRTGKVKVVANITYTPTGGSPRTEPKRIGLIKQV